MIYTVISSQKIERKLKISQIVLECLQEKPDEFNCIKLDGAPENIKDFVEEASSIPFACENKVVILNDPFFTIENDKDTKFLEDRDKDELLTLFNHPLDEVHVIISVDRDNFNIKTNSIAALLNQISKVVDIKEDKNLASRIISRVEKRGCIIERNAAEELANRCQNDLNIMINETNKLMLYSNHITLNDVLKLTPKPLEENVFAISNALLKGSNLYAYNIYKDLRTTGIEPIVIIGMLAKQFVLLEEVKFLKEKQFMSFSDIAKELKINEIRAKITCNNAREFSFEQIHDVINSLADIDYKIKTGHADRFYLFELFLINFGR